jgi:hypothetical protein
MLLKYGASWSSVNSTIRNRSSQLGCVLGCKPNEAEKAHVGARINEQGTEQGALLDLFPQ